MDVPLWLWLTVPAFVLVLLAVDLLAHRSEHVVKVSEAAAWTTLWVACGLGFGVLVWAGWGPELGRQYFAGYLLEKSLALDMVFVWAAILGWFGVPRAYHHRVLFPAILGALVLRGIFIAGGPVILKDFSWVLYLFAVVVLWMGWRLLRRGHDHIDPQRSRMLGLYRRAVPMTGSYHGQHFLVRRAGRVLTTPLVPVLVLVGAVDVIFAVESIPLIYAVTDEAFLVFTANVFAVLGLKAMYFLLAELVERFVHLSTGLSLMLLWVGVEMLLMIDIYYIPTWISLVVVTTIIGGSFLASIRPFQRTTGHVPRPQHEVPFPVAASPEADRDLEPARARRPSPAQRNHSQQDNNDKER